MTYQGLPTASPARRTASRKSSPIIGTVAWYAHMNTVGVSLQQKVKRGDPVGTMGNNANSCGPHVHFHVTPEDPGLWTSQTVLVRYQAYNVLLQSVQTCTIPSEGFDYTSTNLP